MITARATDLATITTWPAAVTEHQEGWYLLASSGATGRVNAVWPLTWTGDDLDAAIDRAEAWYAARNLQPRFKLTDDAYAPADLPAVLDRRGYAPTMPTLIMSRALVAETEAAPDAEISLTPELPPLFYQVLRDSTPNANDLAERYAIARRLPAPAAFAVLTRENQPLAVGASAMSDGLAGVFLMRTAPEARRQGHALQVLRTLLCWARASGAQHAYLQVDADNAPAVALYRREGFDVLSAYRYWRRP